jgi:hypothetical protein
MLEGENPMRARTGVINKPPPTPTIDPNVPAARPTTSKIIVKYSNDVTHPVVNTLKDKEHLVLYLLLVMNGLAKNKLN